MINKVTLNFCDLDLDFARSGWEGAEMALYNVNQVLKGYGIDFEFSLEAFAEDEYPEKFWNESHPEYNPSGIEVNGTKY